MSKKEARIERANSKRLKDAAKAVRLKERPAPNKEIRVGADPTSTFHMLMTWTCESADCCGTWSWGQHRQWDDVMWAGIIEPKLIEFQRLKWNEIDTFSSDSGHKMHHNMSIDAICDEAQDRLLEIEKCFDPIFRFRLGNKRRLWGFKIVSNFEILWFDPEHKIYPTEPD